MELANTVIEKNHSYSLLFFQTKTPHSGCTLIRIMPIPGGNSSRLRETKITKEPENQILSIQWCVISFQIAQQVFHLSFPVRAVVYRQQNLGTNNDAVCESHLWKYLFFTVRDLRNGWGIWGSRILDWWWSNSRARKKGSCLSDTLRTI